MIGVGVIHVGVRPIPQGVELLLLVHLDGDHHAVGHTLRTDVGVLDVRDVGQRSVVVGAGGDVEALGLQVAFEELLVRLVDLGFDLSLRLADLGEEIPVFAGGKSALAVVEGRRGGGGGRLGGQGQWGDGGGGRGDRQGEQDARVGHRLPRICPSSTVRFKENSIRAHS
jgi:hypothetical protein